jgi:hypothetical protein
VLGQIHAQDILLSLLIHYSIINALFEKIPANHLLHVQNCDEL